MAGPLVLGRRGDQPRAERDDDDPERHIDREDRFGDPNAWVRTPPSTRPIEPPRPVTAPHAPARGCARALGKRGVMIDRVAGDRTAAPSPCNGACREQLGRREDAARKPGDASGETGPARRGTPAGDRAGRPTDRRAAGSRRRSAHRRSTPTAGPPVENSRPTGIDGSATLTIEMSRTTMNWARQTTSRSALDAWIQFSGGRLRSRLLWCDNAYPGTREGFILVVELTPRQSENGGRPAAVRPESPRTGRAVNG